MDVCFLISKFADYGGSSLKLKGHWLNMGFKESWPLHFCLRQIKIQKSDWNNWLICDGPEMKCLRYMDWRERGL